ncbi:hypothetical protein LguiB_003669 [Lonicera macranthoides]
MWRAISRCLPTRVALQSQGIETTTECPFCRQHNEDDVHVLVNCSHARAVWSVLATGSLQEESVSMADWWNRLKRRTSLAQAEYSAMVVWALWQKRNDHIWNNKSMSPSDVIHQATQLLEDWKNANSKDLNSTPEPLDRPNKWCSPVAGVIKCNSDASLFHNPERVGYGCVVRDHNGSFVAAMHGSISGPTQVFVELHGF